MRVALSPTAAAELLPWGAAAARRWLRDRGLVRTHTDSSGTTRELVLVSDVEAALRLDAPAPIDVELGFAPAPAPARPRRRSTSTWSDPRE